MVLDYVKSQLLELGIRFPKVYPVSSKLSLEEKENGLSLNKEMSHFENEFYQFIEQDLAQLTIDSAVWDIERGKQLDRKSTRLNSSHVAISYAVFCLKKKIKNMTKVIEIEQI